MKHPLVRNAIRISLLLLVVLATAALPAQAVEPGPGQRVATKAPSSVAALTPFFSDSGLISLSVDALGTNDSAGAPLLVHKNAAGATVRKAYLFAASTGFSGYTPVDGDVTLDGAPVAWDAGNTIPNSISSYNVVSDVTALIKPKVDAAPAGDVSFVAAEPTQTGNIDGEILAVTLDDPTVTNSGTVILVYGAQQTAGDSFAVALADPVDKTNPNFALNLSLGISYGFQGGVQFSTVDVNGTRMTTSAGGQDDCPTTPSCFNGALITAGGIGDLNDNPPDPNADPSTCMGAFGPAPRCDDELYDLLPFVNNGDTSLTFATANPSNDDNIFFAALDVRGGAAIVGTGVVLSPTSSTNPIGTQHTLTATVQDDNGMPISGVTVHFEVTSGPNAGPLGDVVTDVNGQAQITYTSSTAGTDTIVASFTDAQGLHTSNEATKTWTAASNACGASPNSPCVIEIRPRSMFLNEADGCVGLTINILQGKVSDGTVGVRWLTVAGTAKTPQDYDSAGAVVTFPSGTNAVPVSVCINDDNVTEPRESFSVQLVSPVNATIEPAGQKSTININSNTG